MKYMKLLLIMEMALILGTPMLHAQTIASTVRATIPFQFSFAGKTLEAGDYVLSTEMEKVVTVRNAEGKSFGVALTTGLENPNVQDPKLVFRQRGERYYLSQVWLGHSGSGRNLPLPSDRL